jgi:hypothetical protein
MGTTIDEEPVVADEGDPGESMPTVRDAAIGLAIGLVLLYLGTRLSSRLLSWPLIGLGVLFVLVMTGYIIAVAWPRISPPARKLVSRARGHVRTVPQLGTLIRSLETQAWEGSFTSEGRTIEFLIRGNDEPPPALVTRAREVVAEFPALERRLADYLQREAAAEEDPETAAEIRALRIETLFFESPDRPEEVDIHLDGPDEIHYWTCKYDGGELKDLWVDNN